ncbi:hypothetical protein F751_2097 [Auxenochlorella protothecoides]|uniref:Uncharacterized protein n=1 Tax=Auxenochlorella protothecoides TaxID=3075 RepID=A0A087SLA6_AUXPR|nr:hypothetical protein F751_2097 [Auxenochlorella protothecoides]KFM26510.1 hypothetical protein F751_2097 [Auxenochlorella protothecoides]
MMAVETYRAPPRREVDEGGPTEACTLTALPMDAMSRIAGSLSLADAGKLAQTCTTLRACVESPVLRGELLDRWVSCQPRDAGCTKDLLRNLAGPRGDLALLHRLSAWPAGLWVAQSGDQVVESCRLLPLWNQLEVGSYSPPDSGAPRWRWLRSQQKSPSLARIRPSGLSLDMVARWPWFQTGFNPLMGEHGRRVAFHRVATHPVSARDLGLGPRFPPPPDAIARMQGLVTGAYSTHGTEVLSLRLCGPSSAPPSDSGVTGVRLEALKLIGDVNVPGGQLSFVVDAESGVAGPTRHSRLHDFAAEDSRPIYSFADGRSAVVDVERLPICAQFRALGQINEFEGVLVEVEGRGGLWQPEWVPAVFVVYSQAQPHPAGHSCAIVFCDEDRPYRHIIEFTPLPNDLLATLNSERDGDSQPAAAPRSAEPLNRVQAEH